MSRWLLAASFVLHAAALVGNDRVVLTEWLGHIHPVFWLPSVLLLPLAWMPRWLTVVGGVAIVTMCGLGLSREQPLLFRVQMPTAPVTSDEPYRLSFWNVMSFNRGEELVVEEFLADDADIVCLVEGTYRSAVHDSLSRGLGPEYQWVSVRQMALGTRFPILRSRELPTRSRLRVLEVRVLTPDGPVGIILSDLPSPPRLDSRTVLQELGAVLSIVETPFIMVGDLNTSRGSWRLQRATSRLTDFYTTVPDARWLGSWPDAVPLWQIDHAFAGPGVEPVFADFVGRGASNHLRVRIGFTLKESAPMFDNQAFATGPPLP